MNEWDESPAGRRPGAAAGVRFDDPWAAAEQEKSWGQRLTRIVPPRARNLLIAAVAPVVILAVMWNGGGSSPERGDSTAVPEAALASPPAAAPVASEESDRRTYAVAVPSLRGLPEDAPPGTRLELWVAWDPEVRPKRPLQHLLDDVRLERIVPAATPESPPAALLSVPSEAVADLLFGDLFGRFAVTIRN